MNYKITALMVARVLRDKTYEKAHDPPDMGVRVKRPVHVFLMEGPPGTDKILIDTGCPSAADGAETWAPPEFKQSVPEGGGHAGVIAALKSVGLRPQDIKRVILTHGHIENAWNTDLFPDAQIIINGMKWSACLRRYRGKGCSITGGMINPVTPPWIFR